MTIARKIVAASATAAVAGGALFAGAGAASAASDPDFQKVKAPKSVQAGQKFTLKCQLVPGNYQGAEAHVLEKGASINAMRYVASNGDCTMHVVLFAKGARKIRVVIEKNGGATQSKWLKINVS